MQIRKNVKISETMTSCPDYLLQLCT